MAVEEPRKWPYAIPETNGHRFWKRGAAATAHGTDFRSGQAPAQRTPPPALHRRPTPRRASRTRPRAAACRVSLHVNIMNVKTLNVFWASRTRPRAAACRVSLHTSWADKMEQKERKAILRGVVASLRDKARLAKADARVKLQARRALKLRGRLDAQTYQIISNPAKVSARNLLG
jgi:hypothetical protein